MKDLGQKQQNLYDAPSSPESQKNKIIYPEVDLPLSVIEGLNLKLDDSIEIHLKGKVSGMQDTKWTKRVSFECKEGEVKKTGKKGNNILEEA